MTDLAALVAAAQPEELPALIGQLEGAKAAAWARMAAQARNVSLGPDQNLTPGEAAARLGVSSTWIYRNAGKLPFVRRIGRHVRCSARGVAEWNGRQRA